MGAAAFFSASVVVLLVVVEVAAAAVAAAAMFSGVLTASLDLLAGSRKGFRDTGRTLGSWKGEAGL